MLFPWKWKGGEPILQGTHQRDLSQTQVAKMLSMSQTGYSKYETGENDIPTAVLIKLARFYETSIDFLLGETPCRTRYPER